MTVVLPTYNERENLPLLVERLERALAGISYEIIVVDDNSPDGTWQLAQSLAETHPHVRLLRRLTEKGLSSAVLAGFASASGRFLVAMDADLQHDEAALPRFYAAFQQGADLVVGSRKVEGGGIENWSLLRRFVSWGATTLARLVLPQTVSDPMSGFFGVSRGFFEAETARINPRGFKILLEFVARARSRRVVEVGYVFKSRLHGKSKLSGRVMVDYLLALYDLRFGRILPLRFVKYALVGLSGVGVNQGGVWLGKSGLGVSNEQAVALGIEISIITNYFLNNAWTFRDLRLRGLRHQTWGLAMFHLVCAAGALINFAIAITLSRMWGMDLYLANLLGIALATLWNYQFNFQFIWKKNISP